MIRLGAAAAALAACAGMAAAQGPGQANVAAQKVAMQKLAFLAGKWQGPITVHAGPGPALQMTQTENIEYKLDGLVLLVEGEATNAAGKAEFEALATIAWDEATQGYRIHAYNAGHSVDEPLTVEKDGFSWGFQAGPVHIDNAMHLTSDGQWQEDTNVTVPGRPTFKTVEMLLKHEQ